MKTAKELMLAYIESGATDAAALFSDSGALELPYLADIGVDPKYVGPEAIGKFLTFLHTSIYPNFKFENVQIHIDTPDKVLAEYHINAKSGISQKVVKQVFFGFLTADGGKIKQLTEAINLIAGADAIFPGGIAEVVANKSKP